MIDWHLLRKKKQIITTVSRKMVILFYSSWNQSNISSHHNTFPSNPEFLSFKILYYAKIEEFEDPEQDPLLRSQITVTKTSKTRICKSRKLLKKKNHKSLVPLHHQIQKDQCHHHLCCLWLHLLCPQHQQDRISPKPSLLLANWRKTAGVKKLLTCQFKYCQFISEPTSTFIAKKTW